MASDFDDMTDDQRVEEVADVAMRAFLRVVDGSGGLHEDEIGSAITEAIDYSIEHFGAQEWINEGDNDDRVRSAFENRMPSDVYRSDDDEDEFEEDEEED